jgi:hypothetical protein
MHSSARLIYIVIILHIGIPVRAQQLVTIYFGSGVSKVSADHEEQLKLIMRKYAAYDLDSLHFTGMADSIGSVRSNLRLSEKRARNVAVYVKKIFNFNGPVRIKGTGERTRGELSRNRCVNITFYFRRKPTPVVAEKPEEVVQEKKDRLPEYCYYIDYFLLQKSYISTVVKQDIEFTRLEITRKDLDKNSRYYTASPGNVVFTPVELKWDSIKTGESWWEEFRYVAMIPKEDFDRYKIFRKTTPPCGECNVNFKENQLPQPNICLKTDSFLMNNMQLKPLPFNPKMVKARVPSAYVMKGVRYYVHCTPEEAINWEPGNEGDSTYYYALLPVHKDHVAVIGREMECCGTEEVKNDSRPYCVGPPSGPVLCRPNLFQIEAGTHYQQSKNTPYIALGIVLESRFSRGSLLIGTDVDLSLYSSLRYQFHFFTRPYGSLNTSWKKTHKIKEYERFVRLYAGTELKLRINKKEGDYLEQNLHIGIASVNSKSLAFFNRIFLQYGNGLDYLKNNSTGIYGIGQFGVNIKVRKPKEMWQSFRSMFVSPN